MDMAADAVIGVLIGLLAEECQQFALKCGSDGRWWVEMDGVYNNPARHRNAELATFVGDTLEEAVTKAARFYEIVFE
jgi:hypothetical protein